MTTTPLMTSLKQRTTPYHAKIEALPFFQTLNTKTLPLDCYIRELRSLAIIHAAFEREIPITKDHRVLAVWHDGLRKLPLLLDDIAQLDPPSVRDSASAVSAAQALADSIRFRAAGAPLSLLGVLYVLEGSTLGNRMHRPHIVDTYDLNGIRGSRYYASYGDRVRSEWARFAETMNNAVPDPALHGEILAAAEDTFSALHSLYSALFPTASQDLLFHITRVNPEAGNCPMPQDEVTIAAAIRASELCWNEFGYFSARYGQRGRRFCDSDACWLATLADLDAEMVQEQVRWIGRVLATRGMPQITLERTLFYLYETLTQDPRPNPLQYGKLLRAAKQLRTERMAVIPEHRAAPLVSRFEHDAGPLATDRYRNTASLVLSAVADEANGIEGAVSALVDWLTDDRRFPAHWISAIRHLATDASR